VNKNIPFSGADDVSRKAKRHSAPQADFSADHRQSKENHSRHADGLLSDSSSHKKTYRESERRFARSDSLSEENTHRSFEHGRRNAGEGFRSDFRKSSVAPSFRNRKEEKPSWREDFQRNSVPVSGIAPFHAFMPSAFCRRALEMLPKAISAVMPLKAAHRADLPDAVRELSAQLTCDRGDLSRPYWSSPRLVSAYLRYFLPWNLLRLQRLFRSIELPSPTENAVFLDLGSGPLSVPMALWIANEAWRKTHIRLICADTSPHPMALGEGIFRALAKALGEDFCWEIRFERKPILKALQSCQKPLLITAGNVLNEWQDRSTDEDDTLSDRMGDLAQTVSRVMAPTSSALFVEPGTRLGGTLCSNLRSAALGEGLKPVSPCTHCGECPLLGNRDRGWCHVHEDIAEGAVPKWLVSLAENARLPKQSFSYSYMLLRRMTEDERTSYETSFDDTEPKCMAQTSSLEARMLSDAFLVPKLGLARYACSERGLLLIPDAVRYEAGSKVKCSLSARPVRDAKSGALIAERNPN